MPRRALGWTAEILKRLHGVNYPITKATLKEKLAGMSIRGVPVERVIDEIEVDNFETPRDVLHYIAEAVHKLEERGEIPAGARRGIRWAAEVLKRLHGEHFPLNKEQLKQKLAGLYWRGVPIEKVIDEMEVDSVETPADLLHQLSVAVKKLEERGEVAE